MLIEDIKNQTIKDLIEEAHNGSMTIESDLEDAISDSNTEDELIAKWQSALEGLKNEVEHYWSELEGTKGGNNVQSS